MVRLIYVSVMTDDCDTEALQEILSVSRNKNKERDITGVLCYDPSFFMQCLEGPRDVVSELYANIAADVRHKNVVLLEYAEIEDRLFGNWTMAFLSTDVIDRETLLKYSVKGKINPYNMDAEQVRDFLIEVVEQKRNYLASV